MVGLSYPGISQLFVAQLQPPQPGVDRAAVGHLRHRPRHALSRRHPQQRLRHRLGRGAQARRAARRPGLVAEAHRRRRPDLHRQPAAPAADAGHPADDRRQPVLRPGGRRSGHAGAVRPQHQRAGLPRRRVAGRADRRLLRHHARPASPAPTRMHFTLVNGGHTEPLIPAIFHRWMEFLSFYVRKEIPQTPAVAATIVDVLSGDDLQRRPISTLPPDRFTGMTYEEALAAFEAEPPVRVLFESGAGDAAQPGAPDPGFEHSFDSLADPGHRADGLVLRATTARCCPTRPTGDGVDTFIYDPSRSQQTTYTGGSDGIWAAHAAVELAAARRRQRRGLRERSRSPRTRDGRLRQRRSVAALERARRRPAGDALSEIRPDGQENYIQNGWLRASRRKLDEAQSTELRPVPTAPRGRRRAAAAPASSSWPASSCSRSRTRSAPARASASRSKRRAAIAPLWKFEALPADGEVTVDDRPLRGVPVARRAAGRPRHRRSRPAAGVPEPARPALPGPTSETRQPSAD